jgi:nitrate/TMAO reductase-like tetraheme cytochrome c subunit
MKEKIKEYKEFETFRILDKYEKHPEKLTRREKKRLKELGIEV